MKTADKILSAQQIKQADQFTIAEENISSVALMERAANACVVWIQQHLSKEKKYFIFCGEGNNGGDGFAIARLLLLLQYRVQVCMISITGKKSPDCLCNEQRLREVDNTVIQYPDDTENLPVINHTDIIIDALFGTGLSRPVHGFAAEVIRHINRSEATVVSIDIPSGLFSDIHTDQESAIIKASITLSFQFPKFSFLFPQNEEQVGEWYALDIGLSKQYITAQPVNNYLLSAAYIAALYQPRKKFSHKGNFGHALLIAGSYGKMGAAVLATHACLRSGAGLVTAHVPFCGYAIMQTTHPEAMVIADTNEKITGDIIQTESYTAIGIGPGIGKEKPTGEMLHQLLQQSKSPLVLDADAINLLGENKEWLNALPANTILSPHPKEFERIAGKTSDHFQRHAVQVDFSKTYKVYIILKGAHTCITTPEGDSYFNTTGNPGMAKGGSGDVLTGVLTALLAQGYSALEACSLGVYIHGLAGDLAAKRLGQTGMTASDIASHLPAAFKIIESKQPC